MTHKKPWHKPHLWLVVLLVGALGVGAWYTARHRKTPPAVGATSQPVMASQVDTGTSVSGQLVKEGNRYYLVQVADYVEVTIANSYQSAVRAALDQQLNKQVNLVGKFTPGRTDMTIIKLNDAILYPVESYEPAPALPYLPTIFFTLNQNQKTCLDKAIGRDRLNRLIQNELLELSLDEQLSLKKCFN